jgi:hypothetical protein
MRKNILLMTIIFFTMTFFIVSCQKQIGDPAAKQPAEETSSANQNSLHGHLKQTKEFSSEVVFKWIDMQLRLMRTNPIGVQTTRILGYTGIALYESHNNLC